MSIQPCISESPKHVYSTGFAVSQSAGGKALSQPGEPMVVLGLFKVTAQQGFASVKTAVAKLGAELSECVGRDFRSSMVNIFSWSCWTEAARSWDSHQEIKALLTGFCVSACPYCEHAPSCLALFQSFSLKA